MTEGRRTPFYPLQKERGARFVPFAGWFLPVQYSGVVAEHQAVRQRVGLFDVTHMGDVRIEGKGALEALQWIVTNNVAKLVDGKAQYTVMCLPSGGIVDDFIVYREAEDSYFLCVNGARRQADIRHLRAEAERFDCTVTDLSDDFAQVALQGPRAEALLGELAECDLSSIVPFGWVDGVVAGVAEVRIARTGYTGEAGFELYCRSESAAELWRAIENAGTKHELSLCGLAARDTLRLEMKYPLYGNDIDEAHNPIEAGLGWLVKLGKGEFLGREVLEKVKREGAERRWVGFRMKGRGIPRQGYAIARDGEQIGEVTSGSHSPSLGEPIGCGYVPASLADVGTEIDILIRDKPVLAQVVPTPFYKREKQ